MHILSPETNNCPKGENDHRKYFMAKSPQKNVANPVGGRTRNLLITSRICISLSHRGQLYRVQIFWVNTVPVQILRQLCWGFKATKYLGYIWYTMWTDRHLAITSICMRNNKISGGVLMLSNNEKTYGTLISIQKQKIITKSQPYFPH